MNAVAKPSSPRKSYNWRDDLGASRDLTRNEVQAFGFMVGWFEDWRVRIDLPPGVESAREFWRVAVKSKPRQDWQLTQWAEWLGGDISAGIMDRDPIFEIRGAAVVVPFRTRSGIEDAGVMHDTHDEGESFRNGALTAPRQPFFAKASKGILRFVSHFIGLPFVASGTEAKNGGGGGVSVNTASFCVFMGILAYVAFPG